MSNQVIIYGLMGVCALFVIVILAYIILMKRMNKSHDGIKTRNTNKNIFSRRNISKTIYGIYKNTRHKKIPCKTKKKT